MNNVASAHTSGPLTGKFRKIAVYGFLGLALLAPAQAFAECIKTTTRYYLFGVEVWKTESTACTHGDN